MGIEENKELVREYVREINAAKGESTKMQALTDKYFSPSFVMYSTMGNMSIGQYQEYINGMIAAFPDYEFTLADTIAEGDMVAVRMSWSGTHKGELRGIAPTEKKVNVTNLSMWRITDSNFVEGWSISDSLGMMQQLGAIPSR